MMEQKFIKIALFMTMLLCTEFVQARPDLNSVINNMVEISQEIGTGTCTQQRIHELNQALQRCTTQARRSLGYSATACSVINPMMRCMDPMGECYTTQELNSLKGVTLEYTAEILNLINRRISTQFKNCREYQVINQVITNIV